MTTPAAAQFVGDIPRYYDQHLGPIIFQGYAEDLARRAASLAPSDVLEIAAGTGISTAALRQALPPATTITATDLNAAMLEIAQTKISAGNVRFQTADAMALPFADAAFDLVVIQFGVMFFPDRPAAYAEARRVLKPGGTLLFNAWGSFAANPFGEIAHRDAERFLPDNPPKFYLTPFGYSDSAQVRADLLAGGFRDVDHAVVQFSRDVPDWRHFATGAIYGNPMIVDIRNGGVNPDDMVEAIASELEARFGKAPSRMPLEAHVYAAKKR
jgi:SAM-dependent methyltransferase